MTLELIFKNPNIVSLVLKNGKEVIDEVDLQFDRNLEHILISSLDKILNKNKMSLSSLKIMKIGGEVKKDSLSYQIATSFKKALNLWDFLLVFPGQA